MLDPTTIDRELFKCDPAGYSRSAWMRWAMIAVSNGGDLDPFRPPSSSDLKQPVLWLAQAEALTQAASALIKHQPTFDNMPREIRGICDSQYCATALMLVGYSLEVCLKAMIILRLGREAYESEEKLHMHHRLHQLADFMGQLSGKDKAVLELLSHFVAWAGRYPDPGGRFSVKHEQIFELSEAHAITAYDIFDVASRVMRHLKTMS